MCLILFGYRTQADTPLIVAANRDEFHGRATAAAAFWDDHPHVLAGRDLVAGGTWLGCTRSGRFAALTNFSHPDDPPAPKSRGLLVGGFLTSDTPAQHYAHDLHGPDYAGFNLLLFDGQDLVYTSNKGTTDVLAPGFYGLSNAELGAQWPKCLQGAQHLQALTGTVFTHQQLIDMLANDQTPADEELPHRGRPVAMERRLAPCFINGEEYGTRASTVVCIDTETVSFTEQSYAAAGEQGAQASFAFPLDKG